MSTARKPETDEVTTASMQGGVADTALPGMPSIIQLGQLDAPQAPSELEDTGVDSFVISNLAIKLGHTVPQFTTEWACAELKLPQRMVEQIYWQLKQDKMVEILGQESAFYYRYSLTERGREFARRLLDISGYVGPAPVSLDAYSSMLKWLVQRQPPITMEGVQQAVSHLVFPEHAVTVAALAAASGRSLFLFGPAGNGKTTLGQALHKVMHGHLWLPYCVSIENTIIRIFDPQCHEELDPPEGRYDRRWVRVRRPLIVAGGEMTMDELDLVFSPALRFYECPPHVKANGGTFLIDDFGRQRIAPHDLLNRWIVPLERHIDFLTLNTGQKIEIPFEMMLIVATNLTVSDVADPAFLRRMGYRLHLDRPSPEFYQEIFERYARRVGAPVSPEVISMLLERYKKEGRDLRCSEPHELIERVRDICGIYDRPFQLTSEVLETAWQGYFGNMSIED